MSGRLVKIERDGLVAVLYSTRPGPGWYSFNGISEMLFDPFLVSMVDALSRTQNLEIVSKATKYCTDKYGEDFDYSAIENLKIKWVPKGEYFYVEEYFGCEEVVITKKAVWHRA